MFFLRYLFTATAVAAFFGAAHAAETAERQYVRLAELPGDSLHGKVGQSFAVDVDLSGGGLHSADLSGCDLRGSDLRAIEPANVRLQGAIITIDQTIVIAEALGFDVRLD